MNESSIYGNPALSDDKFLFVQVNQVRKLTINGKNAVIIEFWGQSYTEEFGSTYLYANLYRTPKAEPFWSVCRQTFGFEGHDPEAAVGTWGKVYLTPSHWKQTNYSKIHFVGQTDIDKMKIAELTRLSAMNAVPWDALT